MLVYIAYTERKVVKVNRHSTLKHGFCSPFTTVSINTYMHLPPVLLPAHTHVSLPSVCPHAYARMPPSHTHARAQAGRQTDRQTGRHARTCLLACLDARTTTSYLATHDSPCPYPHAHISKSKHSGCPRTHAPTYYPPLPHTRITLITTQPW